MRVIFQGTLYFLSSVVGKLLPILLLPVLTAWMAPDEFGRVSIFVGLNTLVLAVVGMSMHTNVTTAFYAEPRDALASLIGNIAIVLAATAALALVVVAVVAAAVPELFSLPSAVLLLMPVLAFMSMAGTIYTTVLRAEGSALRFAGFEIGRMAFNLAVSVPLVVAGYGWRGMVAGIVVAETAFFLAAAWSLHRRGLVAFRYDRRRRDEIMRLSLPLVPHALGGMVIAVSDRLFIERMAGIDAVALYSIGYSFGMAMALITDSTMKAWTPWVYRTLAGEDESGRRAVVRSCYGLIAAFLAIALVVAQAAGWLLSLLVDARYQGAAAFVGWVTFAYAVRGIYLVFFPFLVHARRTGFLAVSTTTAALVNLALNYVLIGRFGAIGGAYATILAFAVSAAMVFAYQRRHVPMPWLSALRSRP